MNNILKIVWNASLTALVITLLTGLFILAMPPTYRATSTIIADAGNQVLFRSADLLNEAIAETKIDALYLRSWTDALLDREADALNLLRQRLSVNHVADQGWFEVSVEAADPDIAALMANAVSTAFLRRTASSALPDEEREGLRTSLAEAEASIVSFTSANPNLRNPAALEASLDRQAADISNRIVRLETELVDARAEIEILRSGDLAPVSDEPETRRLLQRQQQLITRKADHSTRYGSRHQKMVALEAEIRAAEEMVNSHIARAETRALVALNALSARIAEVEMERGKIEAERLAFIQLRSELNALQTDRDLLEVKLRGDSNSIDTSRYSAAIPPESSLGFGQIRLMMLIFAATFLIVVAIQLLRPARHSGKGT